MAQEKLLLTVTVAVTIAFAVARGLCHSLIVTLTDSSTDWLVGGCRFNWLFDLAAISYWRDYCKEV